MVEKKKKNMSALDIIELQRMTKEMTKRIDDLSNLLHQVNSRLSYLEGERVPHLEGEMNAKYTKITEQMHDSLLAISKATADAVRSDLVRDMHSVATSAILKHQQEHHQTYVAFKTSD